MLQIKSVHRKFIMFLGLITFTGAFIVHPPTRAPLAAYFLINTSVVSWLPTTFEDYCTSEDLDTYVQSLQGIIKFCEKNPIEIDLNMALGLFLINVNLKTAIRHKYKSLPKDVLLKLLQVISNNSKVLAIFRETVRNDTDPANWQNKNLASLMWNDNIWVNHLSDVPYPLPLDLTQHLKHLEHFARQFTTWDSYYRAVFDWSHTAVPKPEESDLCVSSMVANPVRNIRAVAQCSLHPTCYHILYNGTNYGYFLSHRLLLILGARFGRGCAVSSSAGDQEMVLQLCSRSYTEAQYIVLNNFKMMDLLLEHITLCALAGYTQSLHRSWLATALQYQQKEGCFGDKPRNDSWRPRVDRSTPRKWTMNKACEQHLLLGGKCDGHTTSVAAGALASGIRFIVTSTNYGSRLP